MDLSVQKGAKGSLQEFRPKRMDPGLSCFGDNRQQGTLSRAIQKVKLTGMHEQKVQSISEQPCLWGVSANSCPCTYFLQTLSAGVLRARRGREEGGSWQKKSEWSQIQRGQMDAGPPPSLTFSAFCMGRGSFSKLRIKTRQMDRLEAGKRRGEHTPVFYLLCQHQFHFVKRFGGGKET